MARHASDDARFLGAARTWRARLAKVNPRGVPATSTSSCSAASTMTPATAIASEKRASQDRRSALRAHWTPVVVVVAYVLISLAAYWPLWPGDPSRMPLCACSDPAQGVWFLGWIPYALGHLQNPFFTRLIDYPTGANLAQNTEMPLLGLLGAPLSVALSPVSSFNLVMWLAYPASATSLYLVARRFVRSEAPAALAGLLYGFSAYVVGEGLGHPNLSFVPIPPVILLLVFELTVTQRRRALRQGLLLGAACIAQFLISPEVLSTTAIMATVGLAVLAAARPRELSRARLAHAASGLAACLVLFLVVLAYPLWFLVAGPARFHGPVQGANNPYRADLLGPIMPTPAERIAPGALKAIGASFTGATYAENGSYLGIALLSAFVALVVAARRNRWVVFLAVMAFFAFLLSLGPRLEVDGHLTRVPLPFALIVHLPLLENVLPSRISLYQDMFVALGCAVGLDSVLARLPRAPRPRALRRSARLVALGAAVAAPLALLVPAWPDRTVPIGVPSLFTTKASRAIPTRSVVLTYPFAVSPDDQAMLWQALDGYRFNLIGGYALIPDAQGKPSPWPPQLEPVSVQAALGYEALGPAGYLTSAAPDLGPSLVAQTRAYLRIHHVDDVIVDPALGNNGALVAGLFQRALGKPSEKISGVLVWQHVGRRLGTKAEAP
jgi:hypothetical protein